MKQCRIFISGFVHGVGMRHFIRAKANELDLTGFVQNLPDGRVEAVFSSKAGSRSARQRVEKMIDYCKNGPFLSEVENVEVQWEDAGKVYKDFEIL